VFLEVNHRRSVPIAVGRFVARGVADFDLLNFEFPNLGLTCLPDPFEG